MSVPSKLRLITLITLLKHHCMTAKREKCIVFLSCRDSVEFHHKLLQHEQVRAEVHWAKSVSFLALHGGMDQSERNATMRKLKASAGNCVLLCTDVAARGLDVPEIDWVLQYTSPGNPVDYIHRVGRTARAGKQGLFQLL